MALSEQGVQYRTFKTSTSFTGGAADVHRILALGTTEGGVTFAVATNTSKLIGVLKSQPPTGVGKSVTVAVAGRVKVKAGATIALGATVKSNATGKATTATLGEGTLIQMLGYAVEASTATGDLIAVELNIGPAEV